MNSAAPTQFTAAQLRKLCTGKPTPTPGFHPSHKCKDIYLISPTGGPVHFFAHDPAELKNRLAWHKDAMTEWLADPAKRQALVRRIMEDMQPSKASALQAATSIRPARFIEDGVLYFVAKNHFGHLSISRL